MRGVRFLVLYGSQTGTAQDVAERIGRCAKRRRFHVSVLPMDDYPVLELVTEELVLFVCATTGQGEEPDNMKSFWTFLLRKTLPANSLTCMNYGVVGLGDSSYLKFNFTAKRLQRRLAQLGAKPLVDPVYADDQHEFGPDGMIDPWLDNLWKILDDMYPLPSGQTIISDAVLEPPKYQLEQEESSIPSILDGTDSRAVQSNLLSNERVTSLSHFQDVRLLIFNIRGSSIVFEPGDVVMVYPENSDEDVEEFLKLLGLNPDAVWRLKSTGTHSGPLPALLSGTTTVRQCARKYFDLTYIPKRSFFELLWHFADDELEREKLREFGTTVGQEELVDYVVRPRRTVLEVLADFPNAGSRVPPAYLFDLIPPIRPRPFSIANSPRVHPGEIHVLAAIVHFRTKLQKPRKGLCTAFLARLDAKGRPTVPLLVRKGSLRMPASGSPIVMVGPGTGCAPFRGLIQDRCFRGIPGNLLFFGARNEAGDFFFKDEWKEPIQKGLLDLVTAFSRDQAHKIYVQHRIVEERKKVVEMVANGGTVYIAGNAKDAVPDVRSALGSILEELAGADEDGEAVLKSLERSRRLQIEAWS